MYAHTASRPQTTNRLLNALTPSEYEGPGPHLDPVNLSSGEALYRPEQPVTHVYFPSRGTVSLVSTFEDGGTVEVGMVGDEGVFGVCVFLGSVTAPLPARVQLPGEGLRKRADVLRREFQKGGRLQGMSSRTPAAAFGEVFEAVRRVFEARGVRQPGEPQVNYAEGGLTLSRTPLNEYEVRAGARVVSRARHTGAPSSAPVFEPGDRVEEVRRPDRDIRRGMSR